jgi:tetratricopeptide (TPR) repeat protein
MARFSATVALTSLALAGAASAQLGPVRSGRLVELTGRVALEHGGHPEESVRIILQCLGFTDTTITDRYGRFRLRFDPERNRGGICQVYVSEPGVESSKLSLPMLYGLEQSVNLGTIRISDGSRGVVSVTSAEAPKSARKKLERARKLLDRRDPSPEKAAEELRVAVAEYDRYAEAWLELAGVLEKLREPAEALEAYGKAIDADPGYVPAYRPAIQLARRQEDRALVNQWCEDGPRVDPTLRDACEAAAKGF